MDHPHREPHPIPAVAAALLHERRLLLVKRRHPPNAGRLALPGGKILPGESIARAAERELREETGLEAEAGEVLTARDVLDRDADGRLRAHYVIVVLRMVWRGGEAIPGDDAESLIWCEPADLAALGNQLCDGVVELSAYLEQGRRECLQRVQR